MKDSLTGECNIGRYHGVVSENYRVPGFLAELENISEIINRPDAQVLSSGRNLNVKVTVNGRELAVKVFGRQFVLKDAVDSLRGSKARRTWLTASLLARAGVGTPFPVAFLEDWRGIRLAESYYIAEYQTDLVSFGDELVRLYNEDPECEKFMTLMQCVADEVRKMHKAGVQHNDLGNQNILLHRRDRQGSWNNVRIIDLNRASMDLEMCIRGKARDISRLNLPSELLRVFKDMYCGGAVPPDSLHIWERFYRRLYAIHCATRSIRHPIRWLINKQSEISDRESAMTYPSPRDMWIWDERSGQPVNALDSQDRNRLYSRRQLLRIAGNTVFGAAGIWREYKALLDKCWKQPVSMKDTVGVAIEPSEESLDLQLALLNKLGRMPVLIRFYHHKGRKQWDFAARVVKRLSGEGRKVTAALVQDRVSAKDAGKWEEFVRHVVGSIAGHVDSIEVGHAINRVKWGIWTIREYERMLKIIVELEDANPELRFIGPAVIDFEYPFLATVLKGVPAGLRFRALSHHLYVDRRGAPENRQGSFATLEKAALLRALARKSSCCEDRVIISEVNWPLAGAGVYSPVGSPYESPQPRTTDPSVSEHEYGDYMLRYIVETVCSGMVDRVYWWRLVARGYGLVDDSDPDMWRERPGYAMLEVFLRTLGGAEFRRKKMATGSWKAGARVLEFDTAEGRTIYAAYSVGEDIDFKIPFEFEEVRDAFGVKMDAPDGRIRMTGRPVYIYG